MACRRIGDKPSFEAMLKSFTDAYMCHQGRRVKAREIYPGENHMQLLCNIGLHNIYSDTVYWNYDFIND